VFDQVGIGSDLCQNWGYETLEWMRSGRWTFDADHGEGSVDNLNWPEQPGWFRNSQDMKNIAQGLKQKGFSIEDIAKVMGNNWLAFFQNSFESG
jgi:microsomal dipeptidase-like Zn-dependent dipeptidase